MFSQIRWFVVIAVAIAWANPLAAWAQATGQGWQAPGGNTTQAAPTPSTPEPSTPESRPPKAAEPKSQAPKPRIAKVSMGKGSLPNEHGQLWREYDISPFTLKVASTNRPEQGIVDWILRETGPETWHGEPLAILNADRRSLRVYHVPEVQEAVADIVDRFVAHQADSVEFGLRVLTVTSPNWRIRAQQALQPVPVRTAGVQAWLVEREAAAMIVAELRRRTDYREHNSPQQTVGNGQSTTVSTTRGRYYVRSARLTGNAWPGYQAEQAVVDEGLSLEFTPLLSVEQDTVDAIIQCQIDQVEKMVPVMLDVPTAVAPRQKTKIEVPQMCHFQFHERFRWPSDKVLLIGMGMVPLPVPSEGKSLVPGIPLPLSSDDNRGDLLIFVEAKGRVDQPQPPQTAARPDSNYPRRY